MKPDSFIRFENVSNITLESAGAYKVDIICVGKNSGFDNVSGLVVQSMMFTGCIADKTPCHTFYLPSNTSFCVKESSNMMLKNLTFRDGEGGVAAFNVYGSFAIENSLFVNNTEGIALSLYCSNQSDLCSQCYSAGEQLTVVISNSQFLDNHCSFACNGMSHAIHIRMGQWPPSVIHLENLTIANNIHGFHACGMSIYSDSAVLHTVVKGVLYTNNHMIGKLQYLEDAFILGVDSDESYIAILLILYLLTMILQLTLKLLTMKTRP